MKNIIIDFATTAGKVKPMHAVNNGPVCGVRGISNLEDFKLAGIPYARNHDASFYAGYGGNHTVDVDFIFPDFDADPYDPASYDFPITDKYIADTELAGTKTFYRLGSKIEHEVKKYNTLPPKDFHKWAVICEHIIKHYTEGWADGFHYDIEYWEIWNEPDLNTDDSTNKVNWGGTAVQFYEFFNVALKHLKACFPHLKIGGPAICSYKEAWVNNFLKSLETKPDFISWHGYQNKPMNVVWLVNAYRNILDSYGLTDTESILNEWNYVKGWWNDELKYTFKAMAALKGSSYVASVMLACQNAPLDMLMYYDARPCGFNGIWHSYTFERFKTYYIFYAFNELYKLGTNVTVKSNEEDVYVAAAKDGNGNAAIMMSYFVENDTDTAESKTVKLALEGIEGMTKAEIYTLDENNDLALTSTCSVSNELSVDMSLFTTVLIKLS